MKPDGTCLIFKHFPSEITSEECVDFLKSLGATTAQYLGHSGPLKYCAFAEFTSEQHAWNIIKNLHQKKILDRRLSVEFTQSVEWHRTGDSNKSSEKECPTTTTTMSAFSPMWDPSYSGPSQLYYDYPSVSHNVLTNIVRSLASCPAFYNQVLHIMNKLHLPPPFDDPEHFPGDYLVISATEKRLRVHKKLSSASSARYPVTSKRQNVSVSDLFEATTVSKKLHLPEVLNVNTQSDHVVSHSDVEGGFGLIQSEPIIEEKYFVDEVPNVSQGNQENYSFSVDFKLRKDRLSDDEESVDLENRIPLPDQPSTRSHDVSTLIENSCPNLISVLSVNEVLSNCLKAEDYKNYNVFAKYDAGTPTSRLYIKNLSQAVTETDLFKIFGVFSNGPVSDNDWKPSISVDSTECFSVRLLTEGRMKGNRAFNLSFAFFLNALHFYLSYDMSFFTAVS
ncbi:unnamed protein product [Trichobilharzia regenti]|nr:unnamed protein product [Trichobilharzia regenti]